MNNKKNWKQTLLIGMTLVTGILCFFPTAKTVATVEGDVEPENVKYIESVECLAISREVKKERNVLKKRKLLKEAWQTCSESAIINYQYGYLSERLRKYEKALGYYIKASGLDKGSAKHLFGIGDIHMILGGLEHAIAAFEKGLTLNPDNKRAKRSLKLARIKFNAQTGKEITAEEFVQVMEESPKKSQSASVSVAGPIIRMQITFELNSDQLSNDSKKKLIVVGEALTSESLLEESFEVIGHTDNSGNPEFNMQLSKRRAESVRKFLVEKFKIQESRLTFAYFGDTQPAVPNTTEENQKINRRVEFKLTH